MGGVLCSKQVEALQRTEGAAVLRRTASGMSQVCCGKLPEW